MFPSQAGFQQHPQPWQPGFNQVPPRTGPPPAKKQRGNPPVITRYPPPPGYRGPAQPQPPYQQPTWQLAGQPYSYGQQPHPGYQPQPYGPPQPWQQPQYPAYSPPQHYSPVAYPPHTQYQHPMQGYPAPQPTWQPPISTPQSAPVQKWNQPNAFSNNKRRHNSAPFPVPKSEPAVLLDGNGDPFPIALPGEDLEDDFFCEPYYARHPEEINPELSLGVIEWRAALPLNRALPSTFQEAELEALAPRKPIAADEETVSDYFVKSKRDEAFLSVRQTDSWYEVKDDIIFREFAIVCSQILTLSEMWEKYRDRRDGRWVERAVSATPEPESDSANAQPNSDDTTGGAMDLDNGLSSDDPYRTQNDYFDAEDDEEHADFLGSLQRNMQHNGTSHAERHSRASSVASTASQRITRPQPLMPVHDQRQEDILAALGVTGAPKIVYQTPGPALGAPAPQRNGSLSRHNSVTSNSDRPLIPPPPPPGLPPHLQRSSSYESRRGAGQRRGSNERPGSSHSQHTATGSDFNADDNDATPRPGGRKRGHEDSEDELADEATPRPRQKQQRVSDAYSRR